MRKAAFCTMLLSVAMFLFSALPAAAAPLYLEKPGHSPSPYNVGTTAYGLNNKGQVVGYGAVNGEVITPFFDSDDVMQDLGTLPAPCNNRSFAYGINDAGQVVGYSGATPGLDRFAAFLYERHHDRSGHPPRRL